MATHNKITSISDVIEALERSGLSNKSKAIVREVDDEAHKNPWLFIGIAALLDVILL